ncbi:MAG: hypothetical protein DRI57_25475 [Deltaproteobacteria bacterium]|nr:MAG: hypothetical protein DRI57_25475 [Deltaproteobacteria bacterium]
MISGCYGFTFHFQLFTVDLHRFCWYHLPEFGSAVTGFPCSKPLLNPIKQVSSISVGAFLSDYHLKINKK